MARRVTAHPIRQRSVTSSHVARDLAKGALPGVARGVSVVVALSLLVGCGPELERVSELTGLRVIGVQKDAPYAEPETDVEFRMLWEDAAGDTPRETERFWIGGCSNPPGDLYSGCFAQWAEALAQGVPTPGDPGSWFGEGDRFVTKSAPLREAVQDPNQPLYGLGYVFFGVCAGRLDWPGWAERLQRGEVSDLGSAFPYCLDASGDPLGIKDYIIGYTSVYSYVGHTNRNPVIGDGEGGPAFFVNGEPVAHDCIGEECVCPKGDDADASDCVTPFAAPDLTDCAPGVACIDACAKDGDPSCPEVDLRPALLRELNVDPDTVAAAGGREVDESMWIGYFVDRGSVKSDLRLLNDSASGWNDDYSTKYFAPRDPGPVRIWAVVRDNRGGINWVRIPGYVR